MQSVKWSGRALIAWRQSIGSKDQNISEPDDQALPRTIPRFRAPLERARQDLRYALHISGPFDRFPTAKERDYTPPVNWMEEFAYFAEALGIDRVVVVHPS